MNDDTVRALAAEAISMEIALFDDERLADPRSRSFRLLAGRMPVAISAPHSVRQSRMPAGAGAILHRSEPYTGPLAIQLHHATGAWAIYATRTARSDPNHTAYSPYKRHGLGTLAVRAAPRIILDLHGAQTRDFSVAVGTSPTVRAGRGQELIDLLVARLDGALGSVVVDPPGFSASSVGTVTAHCWAVLGIPAVQIEISRAYRSPRHHPHAYAALYAALHGFIGTLSPAGRGN